MKQSDGYTQMPNDQGLNIGEEYQYSQSYQTASDYDGHLPTWEQPSAFENAYQDVSQTDSTTDQTGSLGFQLQDETYDYNRYSAPSEEVNANLDYETLVRSKHVYYDPDPQVIRKPNTTDPVVYNQNIMIRFLQPPPIAQPPLIIREVRPPQPPPPPPLIIRQHAPPPLPQPPIILRERPPPIPAIMTAQVVTKTLPFVPPPPRSVIVEKLPPLPPKPRDIIIERWIPYESMHKRKVIVHRAEEAVTYPAPKNVIITYEPVQARVIRQFERLGVTPEDPRNYSATYRDSLLDTEQLLAQIRELGITEDISAPHQFNTNQEQATSLNFNEQNFDFQTSSQQQFYGEGGRGANDYVPTDENLVHGSSSSTIYEEPNEQQLGQDGNFYSTHGEDLSTQLAQYGMTTDNIPY